MTTPQLLTAFASKTGETALHPSLLPRKTPVPVLILVGVATAVLMVGGLALGVKLGFSPVASVLATGAGLLLLLFFGFAFYLRRSLRKFNLLLDPPRQARARGQFDEAEAMLIALADKNRLLPTRQAVALFELAVTRENRGDLETCIGIAKVLEKYNGSKAFLLRWHIRQLLAQTSALLGEIDDARAYAAAARAMRTPLTSSAFDVPAEALALAREGRFQEAEALFAREWPELEQKYTAPSMRFFAAQRAFVLTRLERPEAEIAHFVGAARPPRSDELVSLAVAWPEMRSFLVSRELLPPSLP